MNTREHGLRRAAMATGVLATIGIAGSLGVAAVAYAEHHAASATSGTSTGNGTTSGATDGTTDDTTDGTTSGNGGPWSGSDLSSGSGQPHAQSGGS